MIAPVHSPKAFGAAIRARRPKLELTQEDLALSIGVDRRVIGRIERGVSTVQVGNAIEAARAVGLDIRLVPRGGPDA